ncbi:bacteriocin-like protein [Mucilaginibacter rigui]
MKKFNRLSREEMKSVTGGLRPKNDECSSIDGPCSMGTCPDACECVIPAFDHSRSHCESRYVEIPEPL